MREAGPAKTTRGKSIAPSRLDRGPMSSRFAQVQPETLTAIAAQLEIGQLRDWADFCDRMIQRDPDILATYESRLSVISGAELIVEPGLPTGSPERDALAEPAAQWTDAWVRALPTGRYAHESLDGIGKGLAVHEKIYDETDLGLVPVALEWLHLRRFRYGEDWTPRICDIGDGSYNSAGYQLEPDRFVVHEPRALPGYPTGGVLRAVMWLYLIKSWALQYGVSGAEQFAWPWKVATVKRGATDETREKARDTLEDLTADQATVIDEDLRLELLESTVKDGNVWANLVATCDRGIAKALLGMTDLADPTRVGSYAAVETRKGATVDARVLKDERALAWTWQRDLVEPALRANIDRFGGIMPPVPLLRWSITAKRREIDKAGIVAMRVDEVRSAMGLEPLGGEIGAMMWRDYAPAAPGSQMAPAAPVGGAQ